MAVLGNFLSPGIFLDLEVLGYFELYQDFICQTALMFPNIYYSQKEFKHFLIITSAELF